MDNWGKAVSCTFDARQDSEWGCGLWFADKDQLESPECTSSSRTGNPLFHAANACSELESQVRLRYPAVVAEVSRFLHT